MFDRFFKRLLIYIFIASMIGGKMFFYGTEKADTINSYKKEAQEINSLLSSARAYYQGTISEYYQNEDITILINKEQDLKNKISKYNDTMKLFAVGIALVVSIAVIDLLAVAHRMGYRKTLTYIFLFISLIWTIIILSSDLRSEKKALSILLPIVLLNGSYWIIIAFTKERDLLRKKEDKDNQ